VSPYPPSCPGCDARDDTSGYITCACQLDAPPRIVGPIHLSMRLEFSNGHEEVVHQTVPAPRPLDDNDRAFMAWHRLPWWRRKLTRKPRRS
jgi:hypothetical protein